VETQNPGNDEDMKNTQSKAKPVSELGIIQNVNPREMWPHEASDFTPWLADNLGALAGALGLELELESTEVAVGPYSADILARDVGTGRMVVIENQLEKTDHDHLGKSLTYAAVLDASAVVWIAPVFTEEHRKTLDWLNDHTADELGFFGVVIELWQIDGSRPALKFDVVSRPTEIVRQTAQAVRREELSEVKLAQYEFWQQFRDRLVQCGKIPSVQTARPQYWFDVSLGRSGINLSNIANTFDKRIGVRVYVSNRVAQAAMPKLAAMREEIEAELGFELEWDPNPENRDKIIALTRGGDINDLTQRDEQLQWLVDMTVRFREVFSPRIRDMDLTVPLDDESDTEATDGQ
jgi:hypothetical protein